jgi:hypothetical protein
VHSKIRSRCKECGGKSICVHGKRKSRCKECGETSYNEQTKRAADAVVAANRLQIEALGPELEATRAVAGAVGHTAFVLTVGDKGLHLTETAVLK